MINVNDKRRICIVGYALSRVIHRIRSEIYFGNPDWYVYVMVRYGWPLVSGLSFRPENPPPPHPFLWQPSSSHPNGMWYRVWEWWSDDLTVSYRRIAWAEDGPNMFLLGTKQLSLLGRMRPFFQNPGIGKPVENKHCLWIFLPLLL